MQYKLTPDKQQAYDRFHTLGLGSKNGALQCSTQSVTLNSFPCSKQQWKYTGKNQFLELFLDDYRYCTERGEVIQHVISNDSYTL